jgi:hypothetical protein
VIDEYDEVIENDFAGVYLGCKGRWPVVILLDNENGPMSYVRCCAEWSALYSVPR